MTTTRTTRVSLVAAGVTLGIVGALTIGVDTANAGVVSHLSKSNSRVFIEGDSLTVGSAPYLRPYIQPHVRAVTVDAQVGRTVPQGMARLQTASARTSNIWVIALGTNDAASPSNTRGYVSRVMALAGPKRLVIWVNVVRPGYTSVNIALRNLDRRHRNLLVVDWAAHIRKHRSLLSGDQVHLTSRGYQVRASVLARTVRAQTR